MMRPKRTTRGDIRRAECRRRAAEMRAFVCGLSDANLGSVYRCWIEHNLSMAEMMTEPFGIVRMAEKLLAEITDVLRPFWPDLFGRSGEPDLSPARVVFPHFGRSRPGEWRDVPTEDAEVIDLGSHRPDAPHS